MKLIDHKPEEITVDGQPMLQWRIPYAKRDGSDGIAMVSICVTLEQFNSNPYDKRDAQMALDRLLAAEKKRP